MIDKLRYFAISAFVAAIVTPAFASAATYRFGLSIRQDEFIDVRDIDGDGIIELEDFIRTNIRNLDNLGGGPGGMDFPNWILLDLNIPVLAPRMPRRGFFIEYDLRRYLCDPIFPDPWCVEDDPVLTVRNTTGVWEGAELTWNLAPVPLPAGLGLALSGMAVLAGGAALRRRRGGGRLLTLHPAMRPAQSLTGR